MQSARTKDEALASAITAAEHLMTALKLCKDPAEKKQLKSQCGEVMNLAGRIKSDTDWKPSVEPVQPRSRNEQIGQWAAEVTSAQSSTALEDSTSQSGMSHQGFSSTTAPVDDASVPSDKHPASLVSRGGWNDDTRRSGGTYQGSQVVSDLLIDDAEAPNQSSDLKSRQPTDAGPEDRPKPNLRDTPGAEVLQNLPIAAHSKRPIHTQHPDQAASLTPSIAAYSHIHRLKEPVTTRNRSTREDIILLKASMVNGFKCPPWDKNPTLTEFAPQAGTELFT